jgi:hypothetical protein
MCQQVHLVLDAIFVDSENNRSEYAEKKYLLYDFSVWILEFIKSKDYIWM